MGPTATGKTELALRLATHFPIEIISVDSALIYRDMNIGSAKPSDLELSQVPHHLINILSPLETYSVAGFIKDSNKLITDVQARGRVPVLVGGTMMYYNGLLNGISKLPEADPEIRNNLFLRGSSEGWDKLHQELHDIDSSAAARIMSNDRQRIIRALEVYYLTGIPISKLQQDNRIKPASDIKFLPLAIVPSKREVLHARINQRFDKMLHSGFIEEVLQLQQRYPELTCEHASMRSVGYYQVWQYLSGGITYSELLESGKAATRQLAKRQITWLRSMDIINLDNGELELNQLFNKLLHECHLFVK